MANITGTEDNDSLNGSSSADTIYGLGGDDWLEGLDGGDNLFGGDGHDFLGGNFGDDILDGNSGDDFLSGSAGSDTLIGGDGNDTLRGDGDDDSLIGGPGDDEFEDYQGNNVLDGGNGNDYFAVYVFDGGENTVTGGAGKDFYDLASNSPGLAPGSSGLVYIITDFQAGPGGDVLAAHDLALIAPGYNLGNPLDAASGILRLVQSGADTLLQMDRDGATGSEFDWITVVTLQNVAASSITADNFAGLIIGTGGDDNLAGDLEDNLIFGGSGNDSLVGGDGDDALDGGSGADRMEGGIGNDTYFVDDVNDVVVEISSDPEEFDTVVAAFDYSLVNLVFVDGLTLSANSMASSATGNELVNVLKGNASNNTLAGLGGDDRLEGGEGVDTALYSDNFTVYTIFHEDSPNRPESWTVSGPDGSDSLVSVERLQFSDKNVALDLDSGEATGNTVRIIGAAFDAENISAHPDWVGIGLDFFDSGMSMLAVCELVIGVMGNPTNEAFVNTVYENLVGVPPSPAELDLYVGMLVGSGGTITQAQLLELAANSEENATNINLVGLQASGVEFV